MSNEIVPIAEMGIQMHDDEAFDAITPSAFLPHLKIVASNSPMCQKDGFKGGNFALVRGGSPLDMTNEINILVIAWRPKAIRYGGNSGGVEMIVYDYLDPEFKKIEEEAGGNNSGCAFGPEFLVYVPSEKTFATYHMGSKSARREGKSLQSILGKMATIKSKFVENKKGQTWFAPQVLKCSTPIEPPTKEKIMEVANLFNNPPKSEVEVAEKSSKRKR